MTWLDSTLADFVRPMGLPAPSFETSPVIRLSFERRGTLYLERLESAVRVYLTRRHDRLGLERLRLALELCQPADDRTPPVHAGLTGDDELVFLTFLAPEDFIPPTLHRTIAELERRHERVAREP